jgi:hypothetical protein
MLNDIGRHWNLLGVDIIQKSYQFFNPENWQERKQDAKWIDFLVRRICIAGKNR